MPSDQLAIQMAMDFLVARSARDAGMTQALDHAVNVQDGWAEEAYAALERYAATHREFTSEDFRAGTSVKAPTTPKAWGGIFQKAARNGVIQRIGYGIAKQRHLSPCPLWRSAVYREAA